MLGLCCDKFHGNLDGLAATGSELPAHYLVPMTKLEIDAYIYQEKIKGKYSKLASGCNVQSDWAGDWVPCLLAMLEIERGNLYYVNGFISWEELQAVYKKAHEMIMSIPVFPSLKEQLKNAGTFLIGAVAGFFTAGPIGLFTGGAAATQKIISDARAKEAANASALINPLIQHAKTGEQERENIEASMELRGLMPVLIGTLLAGAALVYFGDDLKQLTKA